MKARTLTPGALFGVDTRYVVPLFQRPYVWTQDKQWAPFWMDMQALAERLLAASDSPRAMRHEAPHFLGAIVLEHVRTAGGQFAEHSIVDGQQRLITMQLLLDAAELVTRRQGNAADADDLLRLIRNTSALDDRDLDQDFKVWPGIRDQQAFRATMSRGAAGAGLFHVHLPQARDFFITSLERWCAAGPQAVAVRLHAFALALRDFVRVVVVDLEPGDNAQVVFESLNHRAVPLLAADLIKNHVFQVVDEQGLDPIALYRRYWERLDTVYWRKHQDPSDEALPRIDVFLRHWLIARTLREISTQELFPAFRDYVSGEGDVESILADLEADAAIFADLESLPIGSLPELFRYRVIKVLDLDSMTPLLLHLMRWHRDGLPTEQRDWALRAVESWAVRRSLCTVRSTDTLSVVVDILRELRSTHPDAAGATVEKVLTRAETKYLWPSDAALTRALTDTPLARLVLHRRIKIVLEAIENHVRTERSEDGYCPRTLTVEHIMPVGWRQYWPTATRGSGPAQRRDRLVQSLGNLTLLTKRLNAPLGNRPWTDAQAQTVGLKPPRAKRSEIQRNTTLVMNAELVAEHPDAWDEAIISARTTTMITQIQTIWTRPDQAAAQPDTIEPELDDQTEPPGDTTDSGEASGEVPSTTPGHPLTAFLRAQAIAQLELSFVEIEDIIGQALTDNARTHAGYWRNLKLATVRAIRDAGYRVTSVDTEGGRLILRRPSVERIAARKPRTVRNTITKIGSHPE